MAVTPISPRYTTVNVTSYAHAGARPGTSGLPHGRVVSPGGAPGVAVSSRSATGMFSTVVVACETGRLFQPSWWFD